MLKEFFTPINQEVLKAPKDYESAQMGTTIRIHRDKFPDLENVGIALIGVLDDRMAKNNEGCAFGINEIRKHLYCLYEGAFPVKIADLGNIIAGESLKDTYAAVKIVCSSLIKKNILPLIIGGGQDITFAQYTAYEELEQTVDLVTIDNKIDWNEQLDCEELSSASYLNKIILQEPNNLFDFSIIGYQTFFVSQNSLNLMKKMYFETYRLGAIFDNIDEMEPVIRNANMLSFDISAIRHSDAPGNGNASPNGFYGDQACRLSRYAGINDKLSSIGFYEYNPKFDINGQTANLIAQMIWYFIEGYSKRQGDYPIASIEEMTKYRVFLKNNDLEIVFLKSPKTGRWWICVPYSFNNKNEQFCIVPCTYKDYQTASKGEVPDLWWRTYQKLIC